MLKHLGSERRIELVLVVALFFLLPQIALSQQPNQMPNQMQGQEQAKSIEVSDEEVTTFVKAQNKLLDVQEKSTEKMMTTIEDEGLDVEVYNKIARQAQRANSAEDINATETELQKFQNASTKVSKIQQSMQQDQEEVLKKMDMSPKRYQEIEMAAMQDMKLQERIINKMDKDKEK
ncbi:MAG: DUF4168 domain-containing protein [Fidelibacterota bacterium]